MIGCVIHDPTSEESHNALAAIIYILRYVLGQ